MSLADMLLGRRSGDERLQRAGDDPPAAPTATYLPQSVPYVSGPNVVGLSAVWRCVTLIADLIAKAPWQEWHDGRLVQSSRLVRRPSALMSRREWTWRVVATEALYNTVVLMHVGGADEAGRPWSLLPVPPAAVVPGPTDPWGLMPPAWYQIAGQRVPATELTVIRRQPWPGVSESLAGILQLARREFAAYLAADTHLSRYWQAGGPVTTQISTDQALSGPQADEIAQRWADRRQMGADFPAVFGRGAKASPYGADPTTEGATDARREMVADVGRYFGVSTRILNAPTGDTRTYANVEDDAADLVRYTLDGYIGPVEDAISGHLAPGFLADDRMVIDTGDITLGNLESRARAFASLTSGERPIMTVDEARARGFRLPPIYTQDATPSVADQAPTTMEV